MVNGPCTHESPLAAHKQKIDRGLYDHTKSMAITSVRSTYSLDIESMRRIDNLARRWDVSKSEVLRRALRIADEQSARSERAEALKLLQVSMDLSRERVEGWVADIRSERDAWQAPGDEK